MSDVENQVVEAADDWIVDSTAPAETAVHTEDVAPQDVPTDAEETPEEVTSDELQLVIDGEAVPPTADADDVEMPEDAPNWARDLRQKYKELARENKALKQQQPAQQKAAEPELQELQELQELPEPTLESCDWDEAKFRSETKAWALHQAKVEAAKQQREAEAQNQQKAIEAKQAEYAARKAQIAKHAPDYDSAEQAVVAKLNTTTQNMILDLAKDPTAVVLAAGRNQALLNELASLQNDPIRLAAKIGELNRTASFAPKTKQGFAAEPKIKAQASKPPSASDAAFNAAFPDATFS